MSHMNSFQSVTTWDCGHQIGPGGNIMGWRPNTIAALLTVALVLLLWMSKMKDRSPNHKKHTT